LVGAPLSASPVTDWGGPRSAVLRRPDVVTVRVLRRSPMGRWRNAKRVHRSAPAVRSVNTLGEYAREYARAERVFREMKDD
jgi:hypothetical protein